MGLFDKAKDAISDHQDDIKNQASQHSDQVEQGIDKACLLYTSPSPRDLSTSRMPSSA